MGFWDVSFVVELVEVRDPLIGSWLARDFWGLGDVFLVLVGWFFGRVFWFLFGGLFFGSLFTFK